MQLELKGNPSVVATKNQVSCDLAGEAAILDLQSGIYYGLDAVGARIWELIQEPKTVTEIRDALLEEFDVEPERCHNDLVALLEQMSENKLIEIQNASAA